jgi:Arc/MetJ-type ribon-helix-helix transcriptional regulator
MNPELSPENASFLKDQVATGAFPSGDAAINAAIELLRYQTELRSKVTRGVAQLERGEYADFDDEGLDRFFRDLAAVATGGESAP